MSEKNSKPVPKDGVKYLICPHCGEKIYYSANVLLGPVPKEDSKPPPEPWWVPIARFFTLVGVIAIILLFLALIALSQGWIRG